MQSVTDSPPRAPPIKYATPLGTRWAKEKAAAGGAAAFDLPTDPTAIGPWILGECVGKGASGRVKIAKHRRTGQLAAVKILPIAPLVSSRASLATQQAKSDKQRLGIDREITMMKLMNHPNIMRIYDVYEGEKELFLVLEYVEGGELFDFLVNKGRLPANEALVYFRQIVYGLNYAHTFSIIHRDLKPENILIASLTPPVIKIADWGMAAFAPPSLQLETSCGSPHYASPEIVNGEKYEGNATDIWSCGVILYALLTGRLPFDDKNVRTLLSKVKTGKYDMPTWIDPLARDLLSKMLVVDVKQRITIPEILTHPWLLSQSAETYLAADGTTYSLSPPPVPPSPSVLARPIPSPSEVDIELLSSLRIIWGRHADSKGESIKKDLCSPAGQGLHAKAFYFLLGKYRDESSRNRLDDLEFEQKQSESGTSVDIETAKFNLNWNLDSVTGTAAAKKNEVHKKHRVHSIYKGTMSAPASAVQATFPPNISVQESARKRPFAETNSTTSQPGSPVGSRPVSTVTSPRAKVVELSEISFDLTSSGPPARPVVPTYTRPSARTSIARRNQAQPPAHERSETLDQAMGFAQNLQNIQTKGPRHSQRAKALVASRTEMDKRSTIPGTRTVNPAQLDLDLALPRLAASKAENKRPQHPLEDNQPKVNGLVQSLTQPPVPTTLVDRVDVSRVTTRVVEAEKENMPMVVEDEGWSHVHADGDKPAPSALGLGVAMSAAGRDVGKEVANIPVVQTSSPPRSKKEKERKGRPPPLELPPLYQARRTTFAMLGSPIALSTPTQHTPMSAGRLVSSPVVGEFKGWFSNLFNWKQSTAQGVILYSPEDVPRTRLHVARILDSCGVSLSQALNHSTNQPEVLFCRIDHLVEHSNGMTLKNVRFRVEFRGTSCSTADQMAMVAQPASPPEAMNEDQQHGQYLSTPHTPLSAVTPTFTHSQAAAANAASSSTRPRTSLLMGRAGSGSGSGSGVGNAVSGAGVNSWEIPSWCLCAVVLVHEKGSMSTFRAIWKRLREEYPDISSASGVAYQCASPVTATMSIPGGSMTPYPELVGHHRSAT